MFTMSETDFAFLAWFGRRKGSKGANGVTHSTKPVHLVLKRRDGSVRENDASLCGMVVVGGRDWDIVDEPPERTCARCQKFSKRFEHYRGRRW